MTQIDILKDIIDDPEYLGTFILPAGRIRSILQRLKLVKPRQIRLELKGSTLRTQQKVTALVLDMKAESELQGNDQVLDLMNSNAVHQAAAIATAIHNHNSPTPEYLVNLFLDNFNNEQLGVIFDRVYRRLDVEGFFDNMALLRNLAIVKDTPETTANQPLSETSNSPTS